MHKLKAKCYIWAVTVKSVSQAQIQLGFVFLCKTGKVVFKLVIFLEQLNGLNLFSACQFCDVFRERGASYFQADPRVNQLTNGGLQIFNVSHDDEGLYTCLVENTNLSITATLEVFSKSDT